MTRSKEFDLDVFDADQSTTLLNPQWSARELSPICITRRRRRTKRPSSPHVTTTSGSRHQHRHGGQYRQVAAKAPVFVTLLGVWDPGKARFRRDPSDILGTSIQQHGSHFWCMMNGLE